MPRKCQHNCLAEHLCFKTVSCCYSSDVVNNGNRSRVEVTVDIIPAHKPSTFCRAVAFLSTVINTVYLFTFVLVSNQFGTKLVALLNS